MVFADSIPVRAPNTMVNADSIPVRELLVTCSIEYYVNLILGLGSIRKCDC